MIGKVIDYRKNQLGQIVNVFVSVEEFEIKLKFIDGELKRTVFMNYAHGWHYPSRAHRREARRVAWGFISSMEKRKKAAEAQLHFDF